MSISKVIANTTCGVTNCTNCCNCNSTNSCKKVETKKNEVDSEVKLSTEKTHEKNSYGINVTDSKNFEEDVTNSKGTVYVIMGNLPGCSYCVKLEKEMQKRLDELEEVSTVYNMQWDDTNSKLCWEIYNKGAEKGKSATFPQIAKFVDGEFVELIDNPRKPEEAVNSMISKSTGKGSKISTSDQIQNCDETCDACKCSSQKNCCCTSNFDFQYFISMIFRLISLIFQKNSYNNYY